MIFGLQYLVYRKVLVKTSAVICVQLLMNGTKSHYNLLQSEKE